jgi:hypothetical protein
LEKISEEQEIYLKINKIMISERAKRVGLKELQIFDNFEIDQNLPKHKKVNDQESDAKMAWGGTHGNEAWLSVPTDSTNTISGIMINGVQVKPPLRARLAGWLLKKIQSKQSTQVEKPPVKLISIVEFFTEVTKSYEELTPIAEIAEHYEKALTQAKTMGQVALLQKLVDLLDMVKGEAILSAMGLKKYVTEKNVVDFYEKVGEDKNLKLTWIKNFNRIIPEDVYEAKKDVDERKIFDNYVILHYDPKDNGEKPTKEEIEKKKDPILFGVIKNSRKLYYVADWKDEYCDLTLEEMFKVLKGKVLQINNKTVKTFIDKTKI